MGGQGSGQKRRTDRAEIAEFVRAHPVWQAVAKFGISRQRIHQLVGPSGRKRTTSTKHALRLFVSHPMVAELFELRHSREYFASEAIRVANGGKPFLDGYGADFYQKAARHAEQLMNAMMRRLSIDGDPILDSL